MSPAAVDAVVIGAGQNGLTAAAVLADKGWDVLILEEQPEPGGAVRTAELHPGYRADLFSAFYPLGAVSPAFEALDLTSYGLQWARSPKAFGHPLSPHDDDAVVVSPEVEDTAADLDRRYPGDGEAWIRLFDQWKQVREELLSTLLGKFPPVGSALGLLRSMKTAELLRYGRMLALPVTRMSAELFGGEAARLLLLGNALHTDVPPDAAGSGVMGYILTMLGQDVGFPAPVGGAGALTAALVRRAEASGAKLECNRRAVGIDVQNGRATGVRTADGDRIPVRRAVLADVSAPALYTGLLPADAVGTRVLDDIRRFEWDTPVVKVNYALDRRVPWRSPSLSDAGTVHVGADTHGAVRWAADLSTGVVPESPFLLFGQMTTTDPTRSPEGTESCWAYTHLPRGMTDASSAHRLAERVDAQLEAYAPGFGDAVVGRTVQTPGDLEAADRNLVGGAVNGGTSQIHQQLFLRPTPGFGGARTPVDGVYLSGAGAHPGGGVHGMCGWHAAHAALADLRPTAPLARRVRRLGRRVLLT